jgi:hypothetical protein
MFSFFSSKPFDLQDLKTGDLILVKGDSIIGKIIEKCSYSQYSHIGMIVKDPTYINSSLKGLYLLESTVDFNLIDSLSKKVQLGVGLHTLDSVITDQKKDGSKLYVRQLNCNRNSEFFNKLGQAYNTVKITPYDFSPLHWLYAKMVADGVPINKVLELTKEVSNDKMQDIKSVWCSALIGYMYTEMGLLQNDTPWNLLSPNSFSSKSNQIYLINASLDDEIFLA